VGRKKQLRIKTEELKILPEIIKIFHKYRNKPERIPDRILMALYSLWGVERSFIALYDSDAKALKVKASFGFLPSEVEKAIYRKGEGITGETYRLGVPLFAKSEEILNKTGFMERIPNKNLHFFTSPLKVGDETIGVLGIFLEPEKVKSVERFLETLNILGILIGSLLQFSEEIVNSLTSESFISTKQLLVEKFSEELNIIGSSEAIENLKSLVSKIAPVRDLNVLIVGEEGTGKNLFARLLVKLSGAKKVLYIDRKREETLTESLLDELKKAELVFIRRIDLLKEGEQKLLIEFLKNGNPPRFVTSSLPEIYRKMAEGTFSACFESTGF